MNSSKQSLPIWIIVGLVIFAIGLQIRLYSFYHNISSDAYQQGKIVVVGNIQQGLMKDISVQFPTMPQAQKQVMVMGKLNQIMHDNKDKLNTAFDQAGMQLQKQSLNQVHYLQEIDSYYFYDLTQNILEHGDVSSQVKGSRYFNNLMVAPLGFWEPQTWHPYIGVWVYKIVEFFDPKVDLMTGLSWTPIFILPFIVAAFLFVCRALGCGWQSAFIASIFFILAPIFIQRSTFGWYRNSAYSVLFPLLSMGSIIFALKNLGQQRQVYFYGVGCALATALFAMFWPGWVFVWVLLFAVLGLLLVKALIMREQRVKTLFILSAIVLCGSIIIVGSLFTWPLFFQSIYESWGELQKFVVPHFKDWPDLFLIVSELKTATPMEVISFIGHPLVAVVAFGAILYELVLALKTRKFITDQLVVLLIFAAATFVLTLKAERFAILFVTPVLLIFALGIEWIWQKVSQKINAKIVFILLASLLIIPIVSAQANIRSYIVTIYNSAWERALVRLRDESPKNSIVNTWWAPGHFVKGVARRAVTFDGASIKGQLSYWLGKVYLAKTEREALGVLRMLNTSSNMSAEYLQDHHMPLSKAVPFLMQLSQLNRPQAQKVLSAVLPVQQTMELLKLTHGPLRPSYLLIFNELMDGDLLAFTGKWNFKKVEDLNNDPEALKKVPSRTSSKYKDFVWDLVGGTFRKSPVLMPESVQDNIIYFNNGVMIDVQQKTVKISSPEYGQGVPASIVYLDEDTGTVVENVFNNASLGYSVLFFYDGGVPKAMLMDQDLANSLIVKLYYFDGKGLKYFKPFSKETDFTGETQIYIYRIEWPADFSND